MTEETAGTPRVEEELAFCEYADRVWRKWVKADFARQLEIEVAALTAERDEKDELHRMQLVAIGVVSLANSRNSAARLDRSNPYWTDAYQDVATAIDREIAARERAEAAEAERDAAKRARANSHTLVPKGWKVWEKDGQAGVEGPDGGAIVSGTGREIAGCVLYFFAKAILDAGQYDETDLQSLKVPSPTTDYGRGYNMAIDDCIAALAAKSTEQGKA